LLDDAGFSDASAFGGTAHTPGLDRLAARGLRYNNFHTAAICTSTRAALLTGLNPHRAGFGTLTDSPGPAPGYDGRWKPNVPSIADVLRGHGYATAAIGKWHNTPLDEITPSGPFDRWPTHLGFDYFYGFMQPGAISLWEPHSMFRNTTPVEPVGKPGQRYHHTTDMVDDAIRWIKAHQTTSRERPYFLYFATGAVHFPIHAPKEWIERYRGQFDQGWDKYREEVFARQKQLGVVPSDTVLTPRQGGTPAWDSLTPTQKKIHAREMEAYAGLVSHTDHEVSRLLDSVQADSANANTLIFYIIGDNGGSPGPTLANNPAAARTHLDELGGPRFLNGIPRGWAWAVGTPFQGTKNFASHFGGLRNPLVVSWPGRIQEPGRLRSQFANVTDIAATIYNAVRIEFPTTHKGKNTVLLDGVSFANTFADPIAPSLRRTQYFEMWGHRSIYHDGWVAAARHRVGQPFDADPWELYHVATDFSQARDLASANPKKLADLRALFEAEAEKNNALPLHERDKEAQFVGAGYGPSETLETVSFPAGSPRLLGVAAPNFLRSHRIVADVTLSDERTSGILVSWGCRWSGFVLYVKEGRLIYESHPIGGERTVISSSEPLPKGRATLGFEFAGKQQQRTAGWGGRSVGTGKLLINGHPVGSGTVSLSGASAFWGSFGVGQGFGSPVSDEFALPFAFSGALAGVTIHLQ
jgi:arylsulfatase